MKVKRSKITMIMLIAAMILIILPVTACAAEDNATLTILHVNDRHGRMGADQYLSQMMKDLKADGQNVLLLDAGDSLHGQTTTNLTKGEAMVSLMNLVGYDAMAPGNHDFNFGVDRLQKLSQEMNYPLLAANVTGPDGENLFESCQVFRISDLTVGVFGLATPETLIKSDPRIVAGLTFEDPVKAAQAAVAELEAEKCDIIIALAHLGLDDASSPAVRSDTLAQVPGIDIIIDGHSHTALEKGMTVGDTLIAQTGSFGEHIGVVEIALSGGKLTKTARLIAVEETLPADQSIADAVREEDEKTASVTGAVAGYTPYLLNGQRGDVRTRDTNLSNLITDSMLWATGADMAFLTGGNIRESIDAGDITMGELLTTLPFSNLLVTVELKGNHILGILEHGVSEYPEESGVQIHVAGLHVTFDPGAPSGSRVTSATWTDGSALDPDGTYTVATIEFLAAGGDGYDILKKGSNLVYYGSDADALAGYLQTKPTIRAQAEGRISVVTGDIGRITIHLPFLYSHDILSA